MDKEKEFDELKLLLSSEFPITTDIIARKIIELGYRKADEVRKETAKEIYERVDKWLDEIVPHTREETILICLLGWIKTKFGIEVDE